MQYLILVFPFISKYVSNAGTYSPYLFILLDPTPCNFILRMFSKINKVRKRKFVQFSTS